MNQYQKINGIYKRYREGLNKGKFIIGEYSLLEFEYLKDNEWNWEEKLDGTNIRCAWYSHPLIQFLEFKGKTDKAEMPKHLLSKLQQIIKKEKMIEIFGIGEKISDVCLYGEGVGYKINSGCKYFGGRKEVDFILFDIKIGNTWLNREAVEDLAEKLGIKIVPIVGRGTIDEAIKFVKDGFKSTFGNFIAEGLVIRPTLELKNKACRRIITKIKHKDFN